MCAVGHHCHQRLTVFYRWHQAGRLWNELREFSSIDNSSVPYSPPGSDSKIRTDLDSHCRPVGSMDVPSNSKEAGTLDEPTIPLLGSVDDTNAATSLLLPSGSSSAPHCAAPNRIPGASPGRSYTEGPRVSSPQGPMGCDSSSLQGHSIVSPNLHTGSNWWDDTPPAHYLQQDTSFMGETSPELNLPAFDSTTSFDTLFGMPVGGLSPTWDNTSGQAHFSDDEMMAWLNVPTEWP
jgi:hypothetical protein